MRKLVVAMSLGIAVLFSGCGGIYTFQGLEKSKQKDYQLLMKANEDIVCNHYLVKKGTVLGAYDVSKISTNTSGLGGGSDKTLENALIIHEDRLKSKLNSKAGFVVYPNGQLVFKGIWYGVVAANNSISGGGKTELFMFDNVKCTSKANPPFSPLEE
jgi:hypothetical protein